MELAPIAERAAQYAALGDAGRLAIVEHLLLGDCSPSELQRRLGVSSNLLAHHLDVLEAAGLVGRRPSSGDGRRRYVHVRHEALRSLTLGPRLPAQPARFVCTANSARSQLAAALWRRLTAQPADSAGTRPAARVHPGAVAAARRAGLDLETSAPRSLAEAGAEPRLVITVCDQAHEELGEQAGWLHWSIADPVPEGTSTAFDRALAQLRARMTALVAP